MSHSNTCWRVGAIHRCCVRYGKDRDWAYEQLSKLRTLSPDGKIIAGPNFPRLADIWFRRSQPTSTNHIEKARHAYRKGQPYP